MAQKREFTAEELNKMKKPQLIELTESLHIETLNLTKDRLIKQILGLPVSVTTEPRPDPDPDPTEVFADTIEDIKVTASMLSVPQLAHHQLQPVSDSQLKYNLELRRLELEFEERKADKERKAQMALQQRKMEADEWSLISEL